MRNTTGNRQAPITLHRRHAAEHLRGGKEHQHALEEVHETIVVIALEAEQLAQHVPGQRVIACALRSVRP